MEEKTTFEQTGHYPPHHIAHRLRRIADSIEHGQLSLIGHDITIPDIIHMKIELEEEENSFELEIELSWPVRA
ncbi:MAG: amphi-Trp domain-containing protein [Chloroflexaceae bacterium]|nr:amphi-Trp domain-containing protein [Chloroflexaceae bacterium]